MGGAAGGRLLIVEVIIPPSSVPHYGHYFDLNMLVLLTGRERSADEYHGVLMQAGRGDAQDPGEFRRTQNWIGGTRPDNARFVPPPPHEMGTALDNLEKFLHDRYGRTPAILKAGLAHAQFETIHPFLDGNGRTTTMRCSGCARTATGRAGCNSTWSASTP